MRNSALFGPGGNSESFYAEGHKGTVEAPAWVAARGLDAYEYEAGNGLSAGEAALAAVGAAAREHGIAMSFHAPYFISLASKEAEKRKKSIGYIETSLRAAELLGAKTVVVHMGGVAKMTREEGMRLSAETLYDLLETVPDNGVAIGLETMGKINQLGTLDEVLTLCAMDRRLAPVVDFGHLNARVCGEGGFRVKDDYMRVFDAIACALGDNAAINLHSHFSKIEYTGAGEKRHLTFADDVYGPAFEPLMEAIAELRVCPTIICESAGTMAEDALAMKKQYLSLRGDI
jgi:deoxyribonuclease-4